MNCIAIARYLFFKVNVRHFPNFNRLIIDLLIVNGFVVNIVRSRSIVFLSFLLAIS